MAEELALCGEDTFSSCWEQWVGRIELETQPEYKSSPIASAHLKYAKPSCKLLAKHHHGWMV